MKITALNGSTVFDLFRFFILVVLFFTDIHIILMTSIVLTSLSQANFVIGKEIISALQNRKDYIKI